MAKQKDDPIKDQPISDQDMAMFVASDSDFAFEMRVLAKLNAVGFECSHSGTYRDPVTDKIRQFDIRAVKVVGRSRLSIAAECKNLRTTFPLLISALARIEAEAFHHQVFLTRPQNSIPYAIVRPSASVYRVGEMVGKKSDQVRKDDKGALTSNDEATFEKVNQAVNSCRDLVRDSLQSTADSDVRVVLPMLVVPNGTLWQVDYDIDGTLKAPPRPVTRSNLFLNTAWLETGGFLQQISYRLSHLELVTFDVLSDVVESYFRPDGMFGS